MRTRTESTFTGPVFESLRLAGLFDRQTAADTLEHGLSPRAARRCWRIARRRWAHVWQVTEGNSRAEQIAAGRDWLRINLAATALGLGTQPLSQALQEYPEMAGHYAAIHEKLAPGGGTVQMFARLGYGPAGGWGRARAGRWRRKIMA